MSSVAAVLGADGVLARSVPGFRYRAQQLEMAEEVARTLEAGEVLVCEAGTGTGKTFAYLVPALLSGRKLIISTGTKNLQDQLFHRDLPLVRDALGASASAALLKGRANYLCRQRLETVQVQGRRSAGVHDLLYQVRRWAAATRSGDIAELSAIPEASPVWPLVTSNADNCLGQECPAYGVCHLVEARRRAQEADLVVINHHLLCADLALKEEGFGELLPGTDGFVVDEAHQLPEVAGDFFGLSVSGRQLLDLARDAETEYRLEAGDLPEIPQGAAVLVRAVQDLRLSLGLEPRRGAWRVIRDDTEVDASLQRVRAALEGLGELLGAVSGRGKGLDSCLGRCAVLADRLFRLCDAQTAEEVRWFETQRQGFRLNATPLEISDVFHAQMHRHPGAWVFTSATLAVGDSFEHFTGQLGIESGQTRLWGSPFDYAHQALGYLPDSMPDPRSPDYGEAVCEVAVSVLEASQGRAFVLFTSHRALQAAAERLQGRIRFPLMVQGQAPRNELLARFRHLGDAVLLGTSSFWEGVDVRGSALSCVIIDKLPFGAPDDPVLQARIDTLRERGGNPFMEYQLPQAAIALKQGAGRLIRDETDSGLLVICDPRLRTRPYGRVFLRSLPPLRWTRSLLDVQRFFRLEQRLEKE